MKLKERMPVGNEQFYESEQQEKIYLNAYQTGRELYAGLHDYITFYNTKRPHQYIILSVQYLHKKNKNYS